MDVLGHRACLQAAVATACLACSVSSYAEEPLVPGAASPTSSAIPDSEEGWQILEQGPVRVRAKPRPTGPLPEFWVTATTGVSVSTVQEVLLDFPHFRQFMPYVVESRFLKEEEAPKDGYQYAYGRVIPPVVASRDYVSRGWADRLVNPDGSGDFRTHWVSVDGVIPPKSGVVRIPHNEGVWHALKGPDGATIVHFRAYIDPGGWIPKWLADLGNRTAVPDEIKAVLKESERRAALRRQAVPDAGAPAPDAG